MTNLVRLVLDARRKHREQKEKAVNSTIRPLIKNIVEEIQSSPSEYVWLLPMDPKLIDTLYWATHVCTEINKCGDLDGFEAEVGSSSSGFCIKITLKDDQ